MNAILQKRIEEAAEQYSVSWRKNPDGSESKEMFPVAAKRCFKAGATFALQNQWISVEEALPKDCHSVFIRYMHNDIQMFSTGDYEETHDEWYVDGFGYNANVTHWMQIPSLEGGKK